MLHSCFHVRPFGGYVLIYPKWRLVRVASQGCHSLSFTGICKKTSGREYRQCAQRKLTVRRRGKCISLYILKLLVYPKFYRRRNGLPEVYLGSSTTTLTSIRVARVVRVIVVPFRSFPLLSAPLQSLSLTLPVYNAVFRVFSCIFSVLIAYYVFLNSYPFSP
jgi:hypothetical protein